MTSINKKMRENIDAFFDGSTIIGEKIDFINNWEVERFRASVSAK